MRQHSVGGALATGAGGLALLLVAAAIGATPLLVAGVGLLGIGIAAPLLVLPAGRRVRVTRQLTVARVVEGEPVEALVRVARGRVWLVGAELADPLVPGRLPVPRGRSAEIRLRGSPPRRGRHRLPAPRIALSDPLGLARVIRSGEAESELLVLPRLEPVAWGAGGPRGAAMGARAADAAGTEPAGAGEIDGVRPYRDGTPASRIHWPALARGAGLLERRVEPSGAGWPLVALDARGVADAEALDAAVRAAASLAAELARRGGVRLVLPGERRPTAIGPDLAAWPAAHARLGLVVAAEVGRSAALTTASELVFLVRASANRAPVAPGRRQTVLVLPAEAPAPRGSTVLAVGGCLGYDITRRGAVRAA